MQIGLAIGLALWVLSNVFVTVGVRAGGERIHKIDYRQNLFAGLLMIALCGAIGFLIGRVG